MSDFQDSAKHDRHTRLGWTGSGSVGRLLASEPGGRLERIEPGQERRAIDAASVKQANEALEPETGEG